MSKKEKSKYKEIDEQFGFMSKERRAEKRKEWIEKYGISDMDTAFARIKTLEIEVKRILDHLGMKAYKKK